MDLASSDEVQVRTSILREGGREGGRGEGGEREGEVVYHEHVMVDGIT